jgi:putative toxin-antitoxin system antitoxin component (TIGR02293 family)
MERQQIKMKSEANQELKAFIRAFPRGKNLKAKEITYSKVLKDKLLIAKAVRRGVTNQLFNEIKANSPFDDLQWSNFLGINIRTLQRYKVSKSHILKPLQSEKIFELAEVISMGDMVFDTPEHFRIWLNTPSVALGGEKPINLLDSSYGKDLVLAELNRIEYGVFV